MMKCVSEYRVIYPPLLLLVHFSLILGACRPNEIELPFETIEQYNYYGGYDNEEPSLVVVSQPKEIMLLENLAKQTALDELRTLDFSKSFAIAVFQGWRPTTGYGVEIERITRQGDTVTIYAQFQEPKPDEEKGAAETSPSHLVRVKKIDDWGQDILFNLVVDESIIISLTHFIP